MISPDLKYYGIFFAEVTTVTDEFLPVTSPLRHKIILRNYQSAEPKVEQLASDMAVMNAVRSTSDPAVTAAFEQLLTVMALTKGRVAPNNENE
jgi:hypothetical protein